MTYTFKNFDLDNDVINQINQPTQFQWSFNTGGVGSDDSGNKWTNSTMSAYLCHAVASAGDTTEISNSFNGTFDGNITSKDLYYTIGTQYFNMSDPSSGFSWSEGDNVTKMYLLMINNDLILDKIKSSTFFMTLSGHAGPCSSVYSFVLNTPSDDAYPNSTTIRYANNHGSLSSTNVGVAFLDSGIFCFLNRGNESGASGLLTQLFGNVATPLTQSNLAAMFTSSSAGILRALSANSVEYQNSFIYFCRAQNKEFNYSLNETYGTSASTYVGTKRLRTAFEEDPKTYISGVGLYDSDGNLLAVAKPNAVRKKDFYSEALFKIKITI